ncbi:MAG: hypothetical protein CW341_00635 [Bacteroidetes bacterium]|nr:hypothetical protein [Bacteroidota bacterium]
MKKVLLIVGILLNVTYAFTQTNQKTGYNDSILIRIDSILQVNNAWMEHIELDLSLKQRYKLYPTENIYTFLQLDTKTGMIEQVQWSLDSDNEGTFPINREDLTYGFGFGSGSFELYPTKNMYQFLLLDKTTGRKWHVQWGIGDSKRWIRRIY